MTINLALENALCAHPALLPHVLPFLADQLVSELSVGRLHALRCLRRIVGEHPPSILSITGRSSQQAVGIALRERLLEVATGAAPTTGSDGRDDDSGDLLAAETALAVIANVSAAVGRDPGGKYLKEWNLFCEPLLAKVASALGENLDGLKVWCCCGVLSLLCQGDCFLAGS